MRFTGQSFANGGPQRRQVLSLVPMARLVNPHVDLILVGDSLAMTVYGMVSAVGVTLEMMIAHGRAVTQTASHACAVVDLLFDA